MYTLISTDYLVLMLTTAGIERYDIENELARRKEQ